VQYPAQWEVYGKSAGPRRNEHMLREGKPDGFVAFPGGVGTAHLVRIAKAAGVKVWEVKGRGVNTLSLLTLHQVAERLQVHWSIVRQAVEEGSLIVVRLGRTAKGWRVTPDALEQFIAARSQPCPSVRPKTAATLSRSIAAVEAELDELLGLSKRPKGSRARS
jgi:excisionase family DNA binding protein